MKSGEDLINDIDGKRLDGILGPFQKLVKDRQFRGRLDALSADVLQLCDAFHRDNISIIRQHAPNVVPADMLSAVVGWILGMPAGQPHGDDPQLQEGMQHLTIAAYTSAWSAKNADRIFKKDRH